MILNISRISLQYFLKDLDLKPYKPRLLQALNEDDLDRRLEFSQWILDSIQDDQILWTDEATFKTNTRVNRHNCVYWSDSSPHFVIEQELNVPQVIVWGGGVYMGEQSRRTACFEDSVTSEKVLQMLKTVSYYNFENIQPFEQWSGSKIVHHLTMIKLC